MLKVIEGHHECGQDNEILAISEKLHLNAQQRRAWDDFVTSWQDISASLEEADALIGLWSQLNEFRLDDYLDQLAHLSFSRLAGARRLAYAYAVLRRMLSERQRVIADRYLLQRCLVLLREPDGVRGQRSMHRNSAGQFSESLP